MQSAELSGAVLSEGGAASVCGNHCGVYGLPGGWDVSAACCLSVGTTVECMAYQVGGMSLLHVVCLWEPLWSVWPTRWVGCLCCMLSVCGDHCGVYGLPGGWDVSAACCLSVGTTVECMAYQVGGMSLLHVVCLPFLSLMLFVL